MDQVTIESLSKEQLVYYQQIFSIFDKQDKGTIPTSQFPILVRGLGHCPTEQEVKQMKSILDPNDQGVISFSTIISFLLKRTKEQNIQDQLMEAFLGIQNRSSSDGDKSYTISVKQAKINLMDFGESFSESQMQKFLQFLQQNNLKDGYSSFKFKDLAKIMAYSYQA